MIYSRQDLLALEFMTDTELEQKIGKAKEDLISVQTYFQQMEDEQREICPFESCLPRLDILFSNIKNIEWYIRKAENLLNGYDDDKFINKAIKNRKENISGIKSSMNKRRIKLLSI